MKAAFIDRDGTICQDVPDEQWASIKEPILIEGAIQGLRLLLERGYSLIMISNQYLIGEKMITEEQFWQFHRQLMAMLKKEGVEFLEVLICPHARNSGCSCMKPGRGMIDQALGKYPDLNLQESLLIGDSLCDQQLAEKIGVPFYPIEQQRWPRL